MKWLIVIATLGVASAASAQQPQIPVIASTNWRFVEVAGKPIPAGVPARLSFGAAGQHSVNGQDGCNLIGGQYWDDPKNSTALTFGPDFASTKMRCSNKDIPEIEQNIHAAFAGTRSFAISNGNLHFLDARGAVLARLAPAAPE